MARLNGVFAMTFATSSPGASTAGQGTTPVNFSPHITFFSYATTFQENFLISCSMLTRYNSQSVKIAQHLQHLYGGEMKVAQFFAMLVACS